MATLEPLTTSLAEQHQQVPDVVKQLFLSQRLRCDKYREEVAQLQEAQINTLQVLSMADRQSTDSSATPLQLLIESMRGTLLRQSERVVALEGDLRHCEDVILGTMLQREKPQQSSVEACRMSTWVSVTDPCNEVTPLETTQRPSDELTIPPALSTDQLNQCNTSLTTPVRGQADGGKKSQDVLYMVGASNQSVTNASPSYFAESATTPAAGRTERAGNTTDGSVSAPLTPSPIAIAGQHFAMEDSTTSSALAHQRTAVIAQSKYDRLKVKYHRLRDSWCRVVEQLSEQRTAWSELWMQHSFSKGLVRCTIRMTPEGVVNSSSPGRAPKAAHGHNNHMAVVSCGRSGPRKAKVDTVIQSSVPSLDAVESLVNLHIPLTQCGGNALFLCYGATGTGRSSFTHDLCIHLVHALSTGSADSCQQTIGSSMQMSVDATVCDEDDVWRLQQRTVDLQRASDGGTPLSYESAAAIVSPLFHERRSRFLNCHLIITITIGESVDEKSKSEGRTANQRGDASRSEPLKRNTYFSRVTVVDMIPFFSITNEVPQHRHGGAEMLAMVSAARAWQLQQISSPTAKRSDSKSERPAGISEPPVVYESSIPLCNLLFRTLTEKYFVECHVVALVSPMGSPEESWDTVSLASKMRQCGIRKAVGAEESYTLPDASLQSVAKDDEPYHPFDTSQILRVDSCED